MEQPSKYVLLPREYRPIEPVQVLTFTDKTELMDMLNELQANEIVAIDLETTGLYTRWHRDFAPTVSKTGKVSSPKSAPLEIVAIGLYAKSIGPVCVYCMLPDRQQQRCARLEVDTTEETSYPEVLQDICQYFIAHKTPLVGYNHYFDLRCLAGFVEDWNGLNFVGDGYWLVKLLGTDGFLGQQHGLKAMQVDILGWDEKGDAELGAWLKEHKLKRSDMWLAPRDILCKYCGLDALSTYHIVDILTELCKKWPAIEVITKAYLAEVKMLIVNYYSGLPIDVEAMQQYIAALTPQIDEATRKFCTHPDVAPYIQRRYEEEIAALPEPEKYCKMGELREPKKFNKQGTLTKSWQMWEIKAANPKPKKITLAWQRWREKIDKVSLETAFNVDSDQQLRVLMYDILGFMPLAFTKQRRNSTKEPSPSVGKDAYGGWGELGKILEARSKLITKKQQATSWLENTDKTTGILHPSFKVPGTTTTRLAGSDGVPILNPIKEKEFMQCIREPEPDKYIWIDNDFAALEAVLMGHITQDAGYLSIYGPQAIPEDIYLYFGGHITGLKEAFVAAGYTPGCGDKKAISHAKKECKELRNVAKMAVLSLGYGSGARKLYESFTLKKIKVNGKPINEVQAKDIHSMYWKVFAGVKNYNDWCTACWEKTGGYVMSPMGIPIASCADKVFKLPNSCVAYNTLVKTSRGILRVCDVIAGDYVFTRAGWKLTQGWSCTGLKSVISYRGVELTPDHRILTTKGEWKEVRDVKVSDAQRMVPDLSWRELAQLCACIWREVFRRKDSHSAR